MRATRALKSPGCKVSAVSRTRCKGSRGHIRWKIGGLIGGQSFWEALQSFWEKFLGKVSGQSFRAKLSGGASNLPGKVSGKILPVREFDHSVERTSLPAPQSRATTQGCCIIVGRSSICVDPEIVRDGRETSFPAPVGRLQAREGG